MKVPATSLYNQNSHSTQNAYSEELKQQLTETELSNFLDQIIHGDCREVLPLLPSECIDFIVTSFPYADRRSKTYGGVKADEYVDYFLPIAEELKRILKPTGSFKLRFMEDSST